MRIQRSLGLAFVVVGGGALASCEEAGAKPKPQPTSSAPAADRVVKTDEEWKKVLTPAQYDVLRKAGTERAFTGPYWNSHEHAQYLCAACGLPLFRSDDKFDSGTGWPSFTQPVAKNSVETFTDGSLLGEERTEVRCRRCGGHLGHVFDDGPRPTGLRYCINGNALRQVLDEKK